MFFTPTFNANWFMVQKVSRYLMVILAVAMLFTPLLYMPKEADAAVVTVAAIVAGVTLVATIWIYLDGVCDRCSDGRETAHTAICTNCHAGILACPGWAAPHVQQCGRCYQSLFTCNTVNGPTSEQTQASHAPQSCNYCSEAYIPCIEGDEHGDGVCNTDDDMGSSGNNNSMGLASL